ncbi:transcriptional repressor [Streptomyces capoamus]|uniref:Transcriptional repressor n=1 Tax=Streptomyces capoamus TaxID=68183 RepID=A0A919BZM2_9ACTN|nr:Fur family transcriptional regulator [Streptomyces capoamus]GGW12455.1 transcriptional repressor [Streptomyces libani subsp. rufus]GHG34662.1 transcriptional repressor [Streptomyces capoamus]
MTRPAPGGEPMALAAAHLRAAGLRVTVQRMAVLAAVSESAGHLDADALRERARRVTGALSLQATYNVLRALTEAGLVRCTQIPGHPARYEVEHRDNHHHFVCLRCAAIRDVECTVGAAPCMEPRLPAEYEVREAAVTFWGVCPDCRGARPDTSSM